MLRIKVFFFFIILLLFTSCENAEETTLTIVDGQNITEEILSDPEALVTSLIGDLIFSPLLYQVDESGETHNVLAQTVKIHPGNKIIDITLKEGIRFHDGREFTAKDILPSVNKLKKELAAKYGEIFKDLKIEVLNKRNFRITNSLPILDPTHILGSIYAYPEHFSGKPDRGIIGTGPFKFNKWLKNGVELVANEDYFEGAPKIKKIIYLYEEDAAMRAYKLRDNEADLMVGLSRHAVSLLEFNYRLSVKNNPSGMYTALFFNNRSDVFADKTIRNAVSVSINRMKLIGQKFLGRGTISYGAFPDSSRWNTDNQHYTPTKALDLLEEGGWSYKRCGDFHKKDGKIMNIKIYYSKGVEEYKRAVDSIILDLHHMGIDTEEFLIDHDEFMKHKLKTGDYDAYLTMVNYREVYNLIHWHSLERNNLSRFSNKEVDRLLMALREAVDIKKRDLIYERLKEIFDEEVPAAFLYNHVTYTAVNNKFIGSEDFAGYVYNLYKIKDWYFNEEFVWIN